MDDYYGVLNSSPFDTPEKIKQKYQQLVLQLHPDKLQQQGVIGAAHTSEDAMSRYHMVQKAWRTLADPDLRKEYDARWSQRNLDQQWPVQEVLDLDEFDYEVDDVIGDECYNHSCRCGGQYILTRTDVTFRVDYVCCSICSLCIKVTYQTQQIDEKT